MEAPVFEPLAGYVEYPEDEMAARAAEFADHLRRRRTVRDYVAHHVPREVLEHCLRAASSAPVVKAHRSASICRRRLGPSAVKRSSLVSSPSSMTRRTPPQPAPPL